MFFQPVWLFRSAKMFAAVDGLVVRFNDTVDPLHRWVARHPFLFIFLFFCSTGCIVESGTERLEPLAISWFWSPFFSFFMTPMRSSGRWCYERRWAFFWLSWTIGVIVVPWIAWSFLYHADIAILHDLREEIGRSLGLGGQTGLVVATCTLVGFACLIAKLCLRKFERQ